MHDDNMFHSSSWVKLSKNKIKTICKKNFRLSPMQFKRQICKGISNRKGKKVEENKHAHLLRSNMSRKQYLQTPLVLGENKAEAQ